MEDATSFLLITVLGLFGSGTESQTVILTPPLANVTEYENTTLNCTLPGEISYWIVPNSNKTYPLEYKQGTCNKDYPWNQTQLLFVFCSTGFFSVTLINVNRSRHREQWICAYYDLLTDTYTNSSTTILVNVPVSYVKLQGNGTVTLIENTTIYLNCSTSPSRPPGKINWWLKNSTHVPMEGFDIIKNVTDYTTLQEDFFSVWNELTIMVHRTNNNKQMLCSAGNMENNSIVSDTILFNIFYPPNPPEIENITHERVFRVIENTTITLLCSVIGGNPRPELNWTCLHTKTSETIYENDAAISTVTVKASKADNELNCTCTSTHKLTIASTSLTVYVLYPPSSPTFSINSKIVLGDIVRIIQNNTLNVSCSAKSKPSADYQWTYMNKIFYGSNLSLTNVQSEHKGTIICTAFNTMDPTFGDPKFDNTSSSAIDLDVLFPPSQPNLMFIGSDGVNVTLSNVVHAVKGDSFDVKCSATSNPKPDVKWDNLAQLNNEPSMLKFVAIANDSIRTCVANNTMNETNGSVLHGIGHTSLEIVVLVPPEIPDVYANEKKIPSNVINVSVIENNTLALRCETFSKPRPEYQWIEHGKLHTNSNTLLIAAPKRNDDLLVECQVSNFMQRDPGRSEQVNRSRNIQLDILYPPDTPVLKFTNHDGVDRHITNKVVAIKGDSFDVHCIATSNPEPNVTWNGSTTINTVSNDQYSNS